MSTGSELYFIYHNDQMFVNAKKCREELAQLYEIVHTAFDFQPEAKFVLKDKLTDALQNDEQVEAIVKMYDAMNYAHHAEPRIEELEKQIEEMMDANVSRLERGLERGLISRSIIQEERWQRENAMHAALGYTYK